MRSQFEEDRLDFKVGDKVVYPNHGVGVIEQVMKKSIGDMVASFYCLRIISTDSTVMVPVGNTIAVGLRKVLTKREVVRVMDVLRTGEVATYDDWKGALPGQLREDENRGHPCGCRGSEEPDDPGRDQAPVLPRTQDA